MVQNVCRLGIIEDVKEYWSCIETIFRWSTQINPIAIDPLFGLRGG